MPSEIRRILVVEDDEDIRSGIAELLAGEGFAVDGAENGAVGLRVARATPPDLVLLDLMMPVLDGAGFLAARGVDPVLSKVPVVVVTAKPGTRFDDCCATVMKPFDAGALLEVVSRCLPRASGAQPSVSE